MPSRATLRNDAFTAGGANPRRSFDRLVPGLAGFRIYAWDRRGQGDADKP